MPTHSSAILALPHVRHNAHCTENATRLHPDAALLHTATAQPQEVATWMASTAALRRLIAALPADEQLVAPQTLTQLLPPGTHIECST